MEVKDININMHADDEYLDQLPIMLKGITHAFPEGDSMTVPSSHEYHELTYVRSGQLDYIINGKRYTLIAGSTIVIRPNVAHSYVVVEECEVACVYLNYNNPINQESHMPALALDPFKEFLRHAEVSELSLDEDESEDAFRYAMLIRGRGRREIAQIVENIISESQQDEYGNVIMLQALSLQLLIQFSRALKFEYEEREKVRTGKAKELVQIAKDYLDNNYERNLSMSELASHVYLSQGYFARAFRDAIGISPMTYLLKVRVDNACILLEHTDIKIATISKRVGFTSPQRFNSAFKKFMKMTPLEYRKSTRLEENQEA